jgi:N-methylhydantoinase B/oxoprolinase/acetone carboxylase alpha subunit
VDRVIEDVRQGYVSPERARRDYGVAVQFSDGEPWLDEVETAKLRGKK